MLFRSDAPGTERHLKALSSAGKWALGLATTIGASVATAALKSALGL